MSAAAASDLADVFGDDTTPVKSAGAVTQTVVRERVAPTPPKADLSNRWKIVLEDNDQIPPTGLFLSANGVSFMLRAGEEALVPPEVINVLNDAVTAVPQVDPQTNQIIGYRSKLRFSYRVLSYPKG